MDILEVKKTVQIPQGSQCLSEEYCLKRLLTFPSPLKVWNRPILCFFCLARPLDSDICWQSTLNIPPWRFTFTPTFFFPFPRRLPPAVLVPSLSLDEAVAAAAPVFFFNKSLTFNFQTLCFSRKISLLQYEVHLHVRIRSRSGCSSVPGERGCLLDDSKGLHSSGN